MVGDAEPAVGHPASRPVSVQPRQFLDERAAAIVAVMIRFRPQSFRIMLMPFMIKLGSRAARNPRGRARVIPSDRPGTDLSQTVPVDPASASFNRDRKCWRL
jgi:hypothetical protein